MSFETTMYVTNSYANKWHSDLYNMSLSEKQLAMDIAKDCLKLGADVVSLGRAEELCPGSTTDYMAFEDAADCYTDFQALRNVIFTRAVECLYKDGIRSLPTLFWFDTAINRLSELTNSDAVSKSLLEDTEDDINADAEGDEESEEGEQPRRRENSEGGLGNGNKEHKGGFNNKLPYGLCAKVGITVPEGTVYSDAWKLFTGKTGITEEEAIKQLQETGEVNVGEHETHPPYIQYSGSKSNPVHRAG